MSVRGLLVASLVALAACGDGGSTSVDAGAYDLLVRAEDIDFDADGYTVAAGAIRVGYVDDGNLVHNLVVRDATGADVPIAGGDDEGKLVVTAGELAEGTLTLAPGAYTLVCTLPAHEEAGMRATLTAT